MQNDAPQEQVVPQWQPSPEQILACTDSKELLDEVNASIVHRMRALLRTAQTKGCPGLQVLGYELSEYIEALDDPEGKGEKMLQNDRVTALLALYDMLNTNPDSNHHRTPLLYLLTCRAVLKDRLETQQD